MIPVPRVALVTITTALLAFSFGRGAIAQPVPIAVEQARQALLPHVQAPETALQPEVVIETSPEGHPEYLFYGDMWCTYRINAVTGEKRITHALRSPCPVGDHPVSTLPAAQLRQIAVDYVAAHFPGYQAGIFTVWSAEAVDAEDLNEYTVMFSRVDPSGAELPQWCRVYLEEDVGSVHLYEERCLPATINTVPNVSESQAIVIGRNWIAQNIDPDPSLGELNAPRDDYPILFKVEVDAFLNQALVYKIPYEATCLYVDAHTGAVIGTDPWAAPPTRSGQGKKKPLTPAEVLLDVKLGPRAMDMNHAAVLVPPGRAFVWRRQAEALGVAIRLEPAAVTLTCGGRAVRLPLVRSRPTGTGLVAWMRSGVLYVPARAVMQLTGRLSVNVVQRVVTLTGPYGPGR